jgi:hypothetical protein
MRASFYVRTARSLVVVLFLIAGCGDGHEPGAERAGAKPCVPKVGDFHRIYDPSVGESEPWYYNDHSFIRDRNGLWHVFAITQREGVPFTEERSLGHATSTSLNEPTWVKQPPALVVEESLGETVLWAPYVLEHEGTYYMFYCAGGESERFAMRLATSTDLYSWTRVREALFEDGYDARDPFVTRIGAQWVMYYTATSEPAGGNYVVAYRTSEDLLHWSPRELAFTDPLKGMSGGNTESPFVVQRAEGFYLFLSLRGDYDLTEVFFSTDPFHFDIDPLMKTPIHAHAAEIVEDPSGSWHISHCGWWRKGLYLAELTWSCESP